jgi:hypothetical protein
MTNVNETIVIINEINTITGFAEWESTIGNLKSWELTNDEIDSILNSETVKCVSPNGRRCIAISKK